ncbi:MAG: T9SS type A sorting domain-containing protein [Ignavibacteriales bacterium]|nr:T9SS type A sorting domain-containing protein [Ignavibacteriales bacterium]
MNISEHLIIIVVSLLLINPVLARPFRVDQIPNGNVNACANCHVDPNGGGPRNSFGKMVETKFLSIPGATGQVMWGPILASYDADGDGISNGDELQDPSGKWATGQSNPGNSSLISLPGDPASMQTTTLTVQFTEMTPHIGEKLELRVVDKSDFMEVSRSVVNPISVADFNIPINNIQIGHSYWIDFYVDHNNNGKYDAPPLDHAWRLELNNAVGNDVINFAHNTNFTDIKWKYLLTMQFTGMTPHIGQLLELRVIDDSTQIEFGRTRIESIPSADFNINLPVLWSDRANYKVEFYVDFNNNGLYDALPTDHAWEIKFNNSFNDATVNFAHNTNFTNINWKYLFTLNLSEMVPHIGEMMGIRLLDAGSQSEISKLALFPVPTSDFAISLPGLEVNHDYLIDFFADNNNNGLFDSPPTDYAWRLSINSGNLGNYVENFTHNTNFFDIQWPNTSEVEKENSLNPDTYTLKQNFPNPFNPTTQINFSIKKAGVVSIKIYNILGKEIATLVNGNLPAGNFNVEWNAANAESGIYIYKLQTEKFTDAKKMVLLK